MADNVIELIIRTTDAASQQIRGIATQLDVLGRAADAAKEAFAGILVGFSLDKLVESITAAETATNDLNRQFAAFGAGVGISRDDMEQFANTVSKTTTLTSESLKEAQANLLNYTSITGKSFQQARDLVVDLAAKMGGDAAEAAELLGRSLQNPISGIRLLAQVGVTLTQSQRETIASLVQTGDSAQAVNFILYQLQQRVQGAAQELEGTLGGALTNLKNSFASAFTGDGADVGGLVDQLHQLSSEVQDPAFQGAVQSLVAGIIAVGKAAADAINDIKDLGESFARLTGGADTPLGRLEDTKQSLEQLIAVPDQDPGAVAEYVKQLGQIQAQIDKLTTSADDANKAMGGLNFGITGTGGWDGGAGKAPPPLFDPLQRQISLSSSAHAININDLLFAGSNAPGDVIAQWKGETESQLDKALDDLDAHVARRAALVEAKVLDSTKAAAQNQFEQVDYNALIDKTFAPIQVSAQKLKTPLTDVEKEGQQVAQSLTNSFENFFQSGALNGRNFAKTMIGFFEQILAKAVSIDLVKALGLDKLFSASSDAGNASQTAGLFGAIFSAFSGGKAGGGQIFGPTWVGENGPELFVPGSSGSIINQRELAYAGGGNGQGLVYAPVNHISLTTDDSGKSTGQLLQFLTMQQTKQQAEFERKLARNGYKIR